LLPRLVNPRVLEKLDLNGLAFMNLAPPYWFAALWQTITQPSFNTNLIIGTLLSITMPVLGIFLVVKVFAPSFNQKLALISGSGVSVPSLPVAGKAKETMVGKMSRWITSPGGERMGFEFCWRMMLRSRDFRMQVYPAIGYMLVLVVVFVLQSGDYNIGSFFVYSIENRLRILAILYCPALVVLGAISTLHMSPLWKASWIFRMSPIYNPGIIISGSIKAVIMQFIALPLLLIGLAGILYNGPVFLPVWLMATSIQILLTYVVNLFFSEYLPFSQPLDNSGGDGTTVGKGMIAIILIGLMAFIHWLIFSSVVSMLIAFTIVSGLIWLLNTRIRKLKWNQIVFAKNMA
jgi:hypothetical protein